MTREQPIDSDEELLRLCREGTHGARNTAYGTLWERHYRAGVAMAGRLGARVDAEDVVSTAFVKIHDALLKGKGPRGAFRPYLYQVIKGVAADSYHPQEDVTDTFDDVASETPDAPWEDSMFDRQAAARAFATLHDRWQSVLWYTEVEKLPPREVSKLMGLAPNSVSALAIRARDALQAAWIGEHLQARPTSPDCEFSAPHLVKLHQGRLTAGVKRKVEAHVSVCALCAETSSEVQNLSQKLALVLATIFVGSSGALLLSEFKSSAKTDLARGPVRNSAARGSLSNSASVPRLRRATRTDVHSARSAIASSPAVAGVAVAATAIAVGAVYGAIALTAHAPYPGNSSTTKAEERAVPQNSSPHDRAAAPHTAASVPAVLAHPSGDDHRQAFHRLVHDAEERDLGTEHNEETRDRHSNDDASERESSGTAQGAVDSSGDSDGGANGAANAEGTSDSNGSSDSDDSDDGTNADGSGDSSTDGNSTAGGDDTGSGDNLEDASLTAGFDCTFAESGPGSAHPSGYANAYGALRARLTGPENSAPTLLVPAGNESVDDGRGNIFTHVFSGTDPDAPWFWWAPSITPLAQWGPEFAELGIEEVRLELQLVVPDGRYSPWTHVDVTDVECS